VLPPYDDSFREVADGRGAGAGYGRLAGATDAEAEAGPGAAATRRLLGLWSLNVLLAWPDTLLSIRDGQASAHPQFCWRFHASLFHRSEVMPKERELIDICREEKRRRKVPVYSVYTGTRRTTKSRLKVLLEQEGFKGGVTCVRA